MFGRDEQDISFPAPIPVHLTYQTAFVDRAGKLQLREDVYGRDGPVLTAMRGDERKVADVPIERHESRTRPRQVVQLPQRPHPSRTAFSRGLEYQYNGWGSNNWGSNNWGSNGWESRYGSSGGAPFTWWR